MSRETVGAKSELTGIAFLFVATFLLFSLISWSPEDPPNPHEYSNGTGINNICGYFGAVASYTLFHNLGVVASYAFVLALFFFGTLLLIKRMKHLIIRIITAETLVFSASIIEVYLFKGVFPYRIEGGVVGSFLNETLTEAVGKAGTVLLVSFILFLSVFVLAGATIRRLLSLLRSVVSYIGVETEEEAGSVVERFAEARKHRRIKKREKKVSGSEGGKKRDRTVDEQVERITVAEDIEKGEYLLPPLSLLDKSSVRFTTKDERSVEQGAKALAIALRKLLIKAEVLDYEVGPTLVSYRVRVDDSIRLRKIKASAEDLGFRLGVMSPLRVVGPLEGEPDTVAVQIPRENRQIVRMHELMEDGRRDDYGASMRIPLFLGRCGSSEPFVVDLTTLPHLLIAGTTGSGKSICIHSILTSILMTRRPEEVRLILIDPKMVELSYYVDVPHLLVPVVEEMDNALSALLWACDEMDRRYRLLHAVGARDIGQFNKTPVQKRIEAVKRLLPDEKKQSGDVERNMARVVIVVEELADISQMVRSPVEIERALQRLAQKARAIGIHLVLSTQRPSVDVVKGLVKANLPARIAFHVATAVDSRTIIDTAGAEKLLDRGDMFFRSATSTQLTRLQGTFISSRERERIVEFVRKQKKPEYRLELLDYSKYQSALAPALDTSITARPHKRRVDEVGRRDELFDSAAEIVLRLGRASISRLQRDLGIGYERAAKIMDQMESAGIVGPEKGGARPRDVLMTIEEWEARRGAAKAV